MDQMLLEGKSRYGFDATVSRLNEIIPASGWKVLHQHDLQETMRKNGKEILSVKVIELCNPEHAYRLLSDDSLRFFSNMLPCRISVYQKADGETFLSRLNPLVLPIEADGVVRDVMTAVYHEVEAMIAQLVTEG